LETIAAGGEKQPDREGPQERGLPIKEDHQARRSLGINALVLQENREPGA